MTRINVIPVNELCDEHLRAEHREIVRIPKAVIEKHYKIDGIPSEYTVRTEDNPDGGQGHVKFFYDKLLFLENRFKELCREMKKRKFKCNEEYPKGFINRRLKNGYEPNGKAIKLNKQRLRERFPKNAHYYGVKIENEQNFSYWK